MRPRFIDACRRATECAVGIQKVMFKGMASEVLTGPVGSR
jgi:hypothetical protein